MAAVGADGRRRDKRCRLSRPAGLARLIRGRLRCPAVRVVPAVADRADVGTVATAGLRRARSGIAVPVPGRRAAVVLVPGLALIPGLVRVLLGVAPLPGTARLGATPRRTGAVADPGVATARVADSRAGRLGPSVDRHRIRRPVVGDPAGLSGVAARNALVSAPLRLVPDVPRVVRLDHDRLAVGLDAVRLAAVRVDSPRVVLPAGVGRVDGPAVAATGAGSCTGRVDPPARARRPGPARPRRRGR